MLYNRHQKWGGFQFVISVRVYVMVFFCVWFAAFTPTFVQTDFDFIFCFVRKTSVMAQLKFKENITHEENITYVKGGK